jgi:hypothetical protein
MSLKSSSSVSPADEEPPDVDLPLPRNWTFSAMTSTLLLLEPSWDSY